MEIPGKGSVLKLTTICKLKWYIISNEGRNGRIGLTRVSVNAINRYNFEVLQFVEITEFFLDTYI